MATTYDELKTEIQSELDNDNANLIAAIPSFIHRFERRVNRDLRVLEMECRSSHAILPTGTAEADRGIYDLPADWHSSKTVEVRDGALVWMTYFQNIPALSDSNPTNWLLTKADDLYLYGSLALAEPWLKNDQRIQLWATLAESILAQLVEEDREARIGGGGPPQSRVGTQRLHHGYMVGEGVYEMIPPVTFFDLEAQPWNPRSWGYRPGVFTYVARQLRIMPKPGENQEAGTAGWSGCAEQQQCCTPLVSAGAKVSCLESAPDMYVPSPIALTTGALNPAGFAVTGVNISAANVVQLTGDQYYADGYYIVLTTDGVTNGTFYDVTYTGNDLLTDTGNPVCSFGATVVVAGCA